MATTVTDVFNEYRKNLEITNRQAKLVSERRRNVVRAIKAELSLHSEESKVIGSWDRHTLTRYLYEGDVDVMVILHYGDNKSWDTSEGTVNVLNKFRSILEAAYPDTPKRRDRNCITMQFSEFRLDVVPAFAVEDALTGHYKIPDSVRRLWVPTNPIAFASKLTAINTNMDGTFIPLIKMVKGWNRNVGWPIRSFHLECLLHQHYREYSEGYTYPSMLRVFFRSLPSYLTAACYDPVQGDRVDTYLDNGAAKPRRQLATEKAQTAALLAHEACSYGDEDPEQAIATWKYLLGEFFPAYG